MGSRVPSGPWKPRSDQILSEERLHGFVAEEIDGEALQGVQARDGVDDDAADEQVGLERERVEQGTDQIVGRPQPAAQGKPGKPCGGGHAGQSTVMRCRRSLLQPERICRVQRAVVVDRRHPPFNLELTGQPPR